MSTPHSAAELIDQDRLVASFLELAAINAPSGAERDIAEILAARLRALHFSVQFDQAHVHTGGNCGNLIARWNGTRPDLPAMFLSTHMDTVLPTAGLHPVIRDGIIYSDGTTILGADDRAALAAYLEGVRAVQESGVPCAPLELILTVSEQPGLLGARHLDYSLVTARAGYVFDSSGDVGQIIVKGPYSSRIGWHIQGKPAHLGLAPEDGVSAILIAAEALREMRLGKVEPGTHANVGTIRGGRLPSIIPDQVEMWGEARSWSGERLEAQLQQMAAAVAQAATRRGGSARSEIEKKYVGFAFAVESPPVQLAVRAAGRIGIRPYFTDTLGGADTNIFNEHGLVCLTLGNGFRNIHSFQEHLSIRNLVDAARYVPTLLAEFTEMQQRPGAAAPEGRTDLEEKVRRDTQPRR